MSDTYEFITAEYAATLTQNMTEVPPITKMRVWLDDLDGPGGEYRVRRAGERRVPVPGTGTHIIRATAGRHHMGDVLLSQRFCLTE